MSTDVYKYKLTEKVRNHTIWILLNDVPGPFNDWEEGRPISGSLIVRNGPLKTESAGQRCFSGGGGSEEVLILRAASWSTKVGASGEAELFVYENSTAYYTWELIEKSAK
jgi:hypothetical protein